MATQPAILTSRHQWDCHLPLVLWSYRTMVRKSSRCMPAVLVLGWELWTPVDLGPSWAGDRWVHWAGLLPTADGPREGGRRVHWWCCTETDLLPKDLKPHLRLGMSWSLSRLRPRETDSGGHQVGSAVPATRTLGRLCHGWWGRRDDWPLKWGLYGNPQRWTTGVCPLGAMDYRGTCCVFVIKS